MPIAQFFAQIRNDGASLAHGPLARGAILHASSSACDPVATTGTGSGKPDGDWSEALPGFYFDLLLISLVSRAARASSIQFSSGSHSSAEVQSVHARKHSDFAETLISALVAMISSPVTCAGSTHSPVFARRR
jgi:hypothetical protein